MKFESAVEYLKSFVSYESALNYQYDEKNFNLQKLRDFLDDYGIDYSAVKYVHVGGSKGKGSVSTMIANYLYESGENVGLFTSPYILDIRECFWVQGELISEDDFAIYVEELKAYIDGIGGCELTYFELLTVLVLAYFRDMGVEYAVLEVGLGGRLDSTNIVVPELSILTTVEKEHSSILGESLEEILSEKLGIVKEGVPFLLGYQSDEVKGIVKREIGTRDEMFFVDEMDGIGDFEVSGGSLVQEKNAAIAFAAIKILFDEVDLDAFDLVLKNFSMLGHFDIRDVDGKTVVFDMAHTILSMENLIKSLEKKFPGKKFVFLLSILRDKQVDELLSMVFAFADRVIFTSIDIERGLSAKELKGNRDAKFIENPKKAYEASLEFLSENEVLVVTGSHYLLKDFL